MEKQKSLNGHNAKMPAADKGACLLFALDERRYAIPLSAVERVIRAVEITPLPKAPEVLLGVINEQGKIIPVVDVRSRFRLPARELRCNDRFILVRTPRRVVAVVADSVSEIKLLPQDAMDSSKQAFPCMEYLHGIAAMDDGLVLINDLDRFLSLEEESALDTALEGKGEK